MFANVFAFRRVHRAGLLWQIAVQKFAERSLANEAYAGAIFFSVIWQRVFQRDLAHFRFA